MSARDLLLLNSASDLKIGDPLEGGFYAGMIREAPGSSTIYRLIVAPRSAERLLRWHDDISGTNVAQGNLYNGVANKSIFVDSTYPAGWYCNNLTLNGYSDWYLPARDELELIYRNFRPGGIVMYIGAQVPRIDGSGLYTITNHRVDGKQNGENEVSIPIGGPYDSTTPSVTSIARFDPNQGTEYFQPLPYHTSSVDGNMVVSGTIFQPYAWFQVFYSSYQGPGWQQSEDPSATNWKPRVVTDASVVRPVRRIPV